MNKSNAFGKKTVMTALFAALISAGCFIHLPLPGGVPLTIQDMMALLSGMLLGPIYGTAAVFIFLVLGSFGLPIFTGKGGIQIILKGFTGGFLIGYMLGALTAGLIIYLTLDRTKKIQQENTSAAPATKSKIMEWVWLIVAAFSANIVLFALGIARFHYLLPEKTMSQVLAVTLIPFIPGNLIKQCIMVILTKKIRPILLNYLG